MSDFQRFTVFWSWNQFVFGVSYFPGMSGVTLMVGPLVLIVRARERDA
jgi:hypothetical protein